MVCARDDRRRSGSAAGPAHQLGRDPGVAVPGAVAAGHLGQLVIDGLLLKPLGRELIQPGAEPFGQPPRVGEDDRGVVALDQVEHPLLDVRPDRVLPGGIAGARGIQVRAARLAALARRRAAALARRRAAGGRGRQLQVGHVLDRYDDAQVQLLLARRLHDGHGHRAAEEGGHFLRRPDRGGQPDPLRRASPRRCRAASVRAAAARAPVASGHPAQRVQALQGQRQVSTALPARQRMHLVDDDRLHVPQPVPCP